MSIRRVVLSVVGAAVVAQTLVLAGASSAAGPAARPAGGSQALPGVPALPYPIGPSPTPAPAPQPAPRPKPAAPPTVGPADRWALLVGISSYTAPTHPTYGGAGDVALIRSVLLSKGWRSDHILVLSDSGAKAQAISDGLAWLQSRSSTRTFSLFHYSGHVKQTGGHEYLWSQDNRFFLDTDVARSLKALRGSAWVDIAGCESGGFQEGMGSSKLQWSSSSQSDEKSYEDPKAKLSIWVQQLWDVGIRQGKGDTNGDGKVTVQEAIGFAAPRATTITRNQSAHGPQHPTHAGGNSTLRLEAPPA